MAAEQAVARLGCQVMAALLEAVAGPLVGEEQDRAFCPGMLLGGGGQDVPGPGHCQRATP
jgi:hypothetical protein